MAQRKTTLEFLERRKTPRFQIKSPVEFEKGKGLTRDFSTSGIYFETDASFALGEHLKFSLLLEHMEPMPVYLKCEGKVVRVEPIHEKTGVAVAINYWRFEGLQRSPLGASE